MAIAHIPDLSNLSFEMEYSGYDGIVRSHSRSNTSTFVAACKQLYDYMRKILGGDIPANMEWDVLAKKLANDFLIDASKELKMREATAVLKLKNHWSVIFPDYEYDYNNERIKNDFITVKLNDSRIIKINGTEMSLTAKNYSDDFYKFNYFADLHLIKMCGDHPRNWLSLDEVENTANHS